MAPATTLLVFIVNVFLAAQDRSIGDLVTHSLSRLPFDFSYNNINYNVYRHSDLDLD